MRLHLFSFLFLLLAAVTPAQEAFDWQIFSSKSNLATALYDGEKIWTGSEGGVYSFNIADSTFTTLTKANGLNGSPVKAIVVDPYRKIWFGSLNGIIDVYNPATGSFNRIMAIANSNKTLRGINGLSLSGDTIVVATDFGVSLINSRTLDFYDTYVKFGSIPANTKVNSIRRSGLYYVSTQSGLAVQKPGTTNLNDPNAWDVFTSVPGFTTVIFYFLEESGGELIAGTSRGLFKFSSGVFTPYISELSGKTVKNAIQDGTSTWYLVDYAVPGGTRSTLYKVTNGVITFSRTDLPVLFGLIPGPGEFKYLPSTEGLLRLTESGALDVITPNGPSANVFGGITVDRNGNVYLASGRDLTGKGYYRFDGSKWTNFEASRIPGMPTNSYYNSYTTSDGSVYLGSYGKGFLRIKPDGNTVYYTASNTPLVGIAADPNFLVISALRNDSRGNLWILNFDAGNRKTLSLLTGDSTWYGFENSWGAGVTNYSNLEIDQSDTKWFTSPLRNYLYYYNERGTPSNTADDISGLLTESNGLNGQKINALAIDKRGDMWIGTDLGVQIATSLSNVLQNSSTAKPRISTVFSLRQQKINSIVVDPVNRKWVGTDAGLFLVSSDGTELIAFYDATNSPLLSNEIPVMGSDQKNGKIFIGQTGGLISFSTRAPSPNVDYSALYAYPSPYYPGKGGLLTIDGLIKDSDITILDVSGNKVKFFSSPGGRVANWDGKDEAGNTVATGVYFIVASDKEGNTVAKIKVAVVR